MQASSQLDQIFDSKKNKFQRRVVDRIAKLKRFLFKPFEVIGKHP